MTTSDDAPRPRAACLTILLAAAALRAGAARADVGPAAWRADTLLAVRAVPCGGQTYSYTVYSPDPRAPLPAVLLLHGAGGRGADMVELWRPLAAREGVVLVAPDLPRALDFEAVAPAVFRCVVDDARRSAAAVDPRRVYLFGYSMGGYLAFDGALLAGDYFAAAAVYGAAIGADYESLVGRAARPLPVALYIGDRDAFYSVAQVRRTRDLLAAHKFPVRYVEFPHQGHAYAPLADRLNADAWAFLAPARLPAPR